MAGGKRNEYLDAPDSEEELSQGYDSEEADLSKGGRLSKRRKLRDEREDDSLESGDDGEEEQQEGGKIKDVRVLDTQPVIADEDGESAVSEPGEGTTEDTGRPQTVLKLQDAPRTAATSLLTKKNLVVTDAAIKKSGVVYLSKIPPYMKPHKLRSLLSPFGTINRLFLVPEDPKVRSRRVRNHGNKKTCYTEGWVEFTRKVDAKRACELLAGRTIGGKKSSYYRDDVWSLIYLKGFKWHHLTEQIAQENAERTSRLRAEISRSTRENKEFVKNVSDAKMLEGMRAKAATKKAKDEDTGPQNRKEAGESPLEAVRPRSFKQVPLARKQRDITEQSEKVTRVLAKIF